MFSGKPGLMQPVADGATKWLPNEIIEQVLRHSQAPEVTLACWFPRWLPHWCSVMWCTVCQCDGGAVYMGWCNM